MSVLCANLGDDDALDLARSGAEFFVKVADARITFVRSGKPAATELILHQNGLDVTARKTKQRWRGDLVGRRT
jgi:hypothetical protein